MPTMNEDAADPLLATIPAPGEVLARMAELARRQRVLRGLLRLSRQKQETLGPRETAQSNTRRG